MYLDAVIVVHIIYMYALSVYYIHVYPPKNGVIALWPNTFVVKSEYYVSQKQIGFNNKIHLYSILLTFISKFTERL